MEVVERFFVHAANPQYQVMLSDHLPPFPQARPDVHLVSILYQLAEEILGAGSKGIVQAQYGEVHIEEDIHGIALTKVRLAYYSHWTTTPATPVGPRSFPVYLVLNGELLVQHGQPLGQGPYIGQHLVAHIAAHGLEIIVARFVHR